MGCQVIETALGTTFVCGHTEPPAPCHFCAEPSAYLCDWKVEKRAVVRAGDLKIGDRRSPPLSGIVVYRAIENEMAYLGFDVGGHIQQVSVPASGTFMVLRPGTCDQPACDACVREPDDDVHYCRDHWRLQ